MTVAADWAQIQDLAEQIARQVATGLGSRLSPINVAAMLVLCVIVYALRQPSVSFLVWLFPSRIYRHASFRVDLKLLLLNLLIGMFLVFNTSALAMAAALLVQRGLDIAPPDGNGGSAAIETLLLFLTADFASYWFHRLSHDWHRLWPIHAVHHSAEELNPITVYRHHPAYLIVNAVLVSAGIGFAQAVMLLLFTGRIDVLLLGGINLFYAVFNLFTANLRHSHIWLRYPPAIEHILISPAQHQVHHSIDPRHFNRNYGEVLAVWDWMFGTLYIPAGKESIRFGLGDAQGRPMLQPHPTLWRALTQPLLRMWTGRGTPGQE